MIPFLDRTDRFPTLASALKEPNGLIAAGADLSSERLLDAYRQGIFPWYSEGEPILWWSPDPRTVFLLDEYKPSRSLQRFIRQNCSSRHSKRPNLKITLNHDFKSVIENCSLPRPKQKETWISEDMKQAYLSLHEKQQAHSVEVWQNDKMVGGIYGVSVGKIFCGESMFSFISNASKVALTFLVSHLRKGRFPLIDCQVENEHLSSLGATKISRQEYTTFLNNNINQNLTKDFWRKKELNWTTYTKGAL